MYVTSIKKRPSVPKECHVFLVFFCYILNFYLLLHGREKLLLLKRREGKIAKIFIKLLVTRGWELPVYNPRENSEILVKPSVQELAWVWSSSLPALHPGGKQTLGKLHFPNRFWGS